MSKKWPIFAYDKTDRLREKRTRGGEGVQNPENSAYVLNGWSLTETFNTKQRVSSSLLIGQDKGLLNILGMLLNQVTNLWLETQGTQKKYYPIPVICN